MAWALRLVEAAAGGVLAASLEGLPRATAFLLPNLAEAEVAVPVLRSPGVAHAALEAERLSQLHLRRRGICGQRLLLCRQVAALVLISGISPHYVFMFSEENPADLPSRALPLRPSVRRYLKSKQVCLVNKLWTKRARAWQRLKICGMVG